MASPQIDDQLRRQMVHAWYEFLVTLDPFRPDLHRYCRRLTGNVWDAEDLVQDTLLRAFGQLSHILHDIADPRGYLLRIASNLWIDTTRRRAFESVALARQAGDPSSDAPAQPSASQGIEVREAGARLMTSLAPQERAAVLLKDIFDLSLGETASILATTVGAVKAALHRGRERLRDDEVPAATNPPPSKAVVDRFVDRYNARDLPGLLQLMSDSASIEMHGLESEIGRPAFERERGWFHHNFYNPFDGSPSTLWCQTAEFAGEPIILVFDKRDGDMISVMRIEDREGSVERVRVYALCPDTVAEIGQAFGHTVRTMGYRFPFDVSAQP